MLRSLVAVSLAIASAATLGANADRWWSHIKLLADDGLNGRDTGSEGYRKAAEYVAAQFERQGLEPAGAGGYFQPVKFRSRRIAEEQSSLALVRDGRAEAIELGAEATFNIRVDPAPQVEAPLVFAGYGLRVPEHGYDDFAGLDLKGKVVVFLVGGPPGIPGPLLSYYQSVRWSLLKDTGAIGTVSIAQPKNVEIPWERSMLSRLLPQLMLADSSFDETAGQQLAVTFNPARADRLLSGSGHSFGDILAAADAGRTLPRFELPASLRAKVTVVNADIESMNVAGVLRGTDPVLKDEYVVLSAHLDHVGIGAPVNGDGLYNGAMDNASGIATLIETATTLKESERRFRRSVVFLAMTAEEKGLLGSRYFAASPTVPAAGVVANLNTDMFLPLFPLRSVIAQGLEESDLAGDLRRAARPLGIEVLTDPEPERNAFIRSDQYSFIRRGIPALSLKVGFKRDSPEHEIIKRWRTERYHGPADDLTQPVDLQSATDFNRLYLRVVEEVANRPDRPRWNGDSFFRRFAQ
jgi:hypothetical protein